MPPTDPPPSDSNIQPVAPAHPHLDHHIPQWAVKGLIGVFVLLVIPGTIAVISYVFGGIHSRLSDHDKAIQSIKERQAAIEARQDRNEDNDSSQWRVIGELKDKIGEHH